MHVYREFYIAKASQDLVGSYYSSPSIARYALGPTNDEWRDIVFFQLLNEIQYLWIIYILHPYYEEINIVIVRY